MKIRELGVEEGDRIAAAEVDDNARANLARCAKHLCEGVEGGPITLKPYLVLCRRAGDKVSDEIIRPIAAKDEGIVPGPADHAVNAGPANQEIIACIPFHEVVSIAPFKEVIAAMAE